MHKKWAVERRPISVGKYMVSSQLAIRLCSARPMAIPTSSRVTTSLPVFRWMARVSWRMSFRSGAKISFAYGPAVSANRSCAVASTIAENVAAVGNTLLFLFFGRHHHMQPLWFLFRKKRRPHPKEGGSGFSYQDSSLEAKICTGKDFPSIVLAFHFCPHFGSNFNGFGIGYRTSPFTFSNKMTFPIVHPPFFKIQSPLIVEKTGWNQTTPMSSPPRHPAQR